ncbi:cache domain-containing protein, partial [Pseudoxanthomonas taiwanensis]
MNLRRSTLFRLVSNLSMKRKFLLQSAMIALGIIGLAVIAARTQYLDVIDVRKDGLRVQAEMARGMIQDYARRAESGAMTEQQAREAALEALQAMQGNGGQDYFFVLDRDLDMVMHPRRPDLVGQPLAGVTSPDGRHIFPAMLAAAEAGGGFVDYTWEKPGQARPAKKTSYAFLYEPWGWVVAVGVYTDDTQARAIGFTLIMTLAGGLLVLFNLGLGWLIGGSILASVNRALAAVRGVSRGDLEVRTGHHGRDEIGQMLQAMDGMVHMLERFSHEARHMIAQHAGPDIGHRMPEDFPGVYGELARGINTMMFEHLDAIMDAIAVLQEYASGDLSRDARRLPGSRAVLHEAMDAAKASLMAINGEIRRLAQAAAEGDFSVRGDENAFRHDFLEMVRGLNTMMATADRNLGQLSALLHAIAQGDLTVRMEGDFRGVFARMRDDANATVEQLKAIVPRIQEASGAISTASTEIASGN